MKKVHLIYGSGEADFYLASEVDAQIKALQRECDEWQKAMFSLEFEETTGECLLGCGGCASEGHNEDCRFIHALPTAEKELTK